MGLKCGLVGLPNVGKSTLFNALTCSQMPNKNYPFCTTDPSTAHAPIPDPRLQELATVMASERVIPSSAEITDIAGLVKGASHGEGLGNQFLSHIREVDALLHVVRCFDDDNVIHVHGRFDPQDDMDTLITEFILADLATVERSLDKHKRLRGKQAQNDLASLITVQEALFDHLQQACPASSFQVPEPYGESKDIQDSMRHLHLISQKKQIFVCNVDEAWTPKDHLPGSPTQVVESYAKAHNSEWLVLSAKIEAEISELETPEERSEMLQSLGYELSGLEKLAHGAYELLGLMHFFTAGARETRAWTIPQNTVARDAAGVIHTDFVRGFIAAQVCSWQDLVRYKSVAALREMGLVRTEGSGYTVADGDVIEFRFNVSSSGKK